MPITSIFVVLLAGACIPLLVPSACCLFHSQSTSERGNQLHVWPRKVQVRQNTCCNSKWYVVSKCNYQTQKLYTKHQIPNVSRCVVCAYSIYTLHTVHWCIIWTEFVSPNSFGNSAVLLGEIAAHVCWCEYTYIHISIYVYICIYVYLYLYNIYFIESSRVGLNHVGHKVIMSTIIGSSLLCRTCLLAACFHNMRAMGSIDQKVFAKGTE